MNKYLRQFAIPIFSFCLLVSCKSKESNIIDVDLGELVLIEGYPITVKTPFLIDTIYETPRICGNEPNCKIILNDKTKIRLEICQRQTELSLIEYSEIRQKPNKNNLMGEIEHLSKIYAKKPKVKLIKNLNFESKQVSWKGHGIELLSGNSKNTIQIKLGSILKTNSEYNLYNNLTISIYKRDYNKIHILNYLEYICSNMNLTTIHNAMMM